MWLGSYAAKNGTGATIAGASTCSLCKPGTYINVASQGQCISCSPGKRLRFFYSTEFQPFFLLNLDWNANNNLMFDNL